VVVIGIRHDAYARAHPILVEEEKAESDRGRYLNPQEQARARIDAFARRGRSRYALPLRVAHGDTAV